MPPSGNLVREGGRSEKEHAHERGRENEEGAVAGPRDRFAESKEDPPEVEDEHHHHECRDKREPVPLYAVTGAQQSVHAATCLLAL